MEGESCCDFKVVSTSSEDDSQQATNVGLEGTENIWQTSGGVDKAVVVLELEEPTVIHTIEVVNASTTNIEVFVYNNEGDNEETLLPTSSMMTFGEVSKQVNKNRLRFFGPDKLTKGVCEKAWKYVKVNCTTFDSGRKPFGLARIQLFRSAPADAYISNAITDNRTTMEPTVMSSPTPASTLPASDKYCTKRSKSFAGSLPAKKTNDNKENKPEIKNTPNSASKLLTKRKRVIENDDFDDDTGSGNNPSYSNPRSLTTVNITPNKKIQATSTRAKSLVFTPFNKIMSDVVIVVSGIANPERSELRDKALEMGAQYFPDWIESATHLVCKFANTPKFVSAQKSGGTIVTPGWILDCHANKTRLPETEYLLSEGKKNEATMKSTMGSMRDWLSKFRSPRKSDGLSLPSSPPVLFSHLRKDASNANDNNNNAKANHTNANTNNNNNTNTNKLVKSFTFINNARITKCTPPDDDIDDTASDTTEPMSENVDNTADDTDNATTTTNNHKPPTKLHKSLSKTSSSLSNATEDMEVNTQETMELSASEDDTSKDNQGTRKRYVNDILPKRTSTFDTSVPLPTYFKHVTAVLRGTFDPAMKTLLNRYITAYYGDIEDKITNKTSHVVTNQVWGEELQALQDKYPSLCIVRPSWVFDSHNEQRLVDVAQHCVSAQ